jgi:hypothetical protein
VTATGDDDDHDGVAMTLMLLVEEHEEEEEDDNRRRALRMSAGCRCRLLVWIVIVGLNSRLQFPP